MPPVASPGAERVSRKLRWLWSGEDLMAEEAKVPNPSFPGQRSVSSPQGEARALMCARHLLRLAFALAVSDSPHGGQCQHPHVTEEQKKLREVK